MDASVADLLRELYADYAFLGRYGHFGSLAELRKLTAPERRSLREAVSTLLDEEVRAMGATDRE